MISQVNHAIDTHHLAFPVWRHVTHYLSCVCVLSCALNSLLPVPCGGSSRLIMTNSLHTPPPPPLMPHRVHWGHTHWTNQQTLWTGMNRRNTLKCLDVWFCSLWKWSWRERENISPDARLFLLLFSFFGYSLNKHQETTSITFRML